VQVLLNGIRNFGIWGGSLGGENFAASKMQGGETDQSLRSVTGSTIPEKKNFGETGAHSKTEVAKRHKDSRRKEPSKRPGEYGQTQQKQTGHIGGKRKKEKTEIRPHRNTHFPDSRHRSKTKKRIHSRVQWKRKNKDTKERQEATDAKQARTNAEKGAERDAIQPNKGDVETQPSTIAQKRSNPAGHGHETKCEAKKKGEQRKLIHKRDIGGVIHSRAKGGYWFNTPTDGPERTGEARAQGKEKANRPQATLPKKALRRIITDESQAEARGSVLGKNTYHHKSNESLRAGKELLPQALKKRLT